MTTCGAPSPEEPEWLSDLLSQAGTIVGSAGAQRLEDLRRAVAALPHDDDPALPAGALRSYHDELWAAFNAWEPPKAEPLLAVATSWWVIANRQAHAAVAVMNEGAPIDALPNVRAAFEHALAVVWLWREKGKGVVDSLGLRWVNDGVEGFRALRQAEPGMEGLLKLVGEMQAEDELPSGDVTVAPYKFGWLVGRLGVARPTGIYYASFSAFCHPTMGALLALAQFAPDGIQTRREPVRPAHAGDPLLLAVQCQCWAGLALDRIIEGGLPFRDRLDAIAESIGLPMAVQLFAPLEGT